MSYRRFMRPPRFGLGTVCKHRCGKVITVGESSSVRMNPERSGALPVTPLETDLS